MENKKKKNNDQIPKYLESSDVARYIYSYTESIFLDDLVDATAFNYLLIYIITDELLNGFFKSKNNEFSFPIDYFEFAQWLNIKVVVDDLNYFKNKEFGKTLGKLVILEDKQPCVLLEYTESIVNVRYALCHEIGHYLCKHRDFYCTWAQLPISKEEILSEIIASFLMLPPKKIFEMAYNYTREYSSRPVDLEELFKYISIKTALPNYRVITSYEHIKTLACYLYNKHHRERLLALAKENVLDKILLKKIEKVVYDGSIAANEFFL